ncbi:PAS domain-containing sensor histidine kinase [uncultured Ferrovibrio sp.]|jgi:two-component system nitrogen regulation sensor histidine kinase NtrY|uniref:sensor histidine kinase NtrY-like n=1 Tax=uncultured Ferrovibrio sp. TaxID=1576913 RepID=UPI00260FE4AA|nr:PAS domain-containing sensor histidine kinase [uncultured Ferrovibrio sp.]
MTDNTMPAGAALAARMLRRAADWFRRHKLIRHLEISLAVAALIAGTLTYLAMTPGANRDLTPREVQILLLTDLVILLSLITLVARRLVMLWMQRRRGAAGSRLHARMVMLFAAVTALPTVLMTVFAVLFFNLGLQTWFSERVNVAVKASVAVAEAYIQEHRKTIRADVLAMAVDLNREAPRLALNPFALQQAVRQLSRMRGLGEAMVFTSTGEILARNELSLLMEFDRIPLRALEDANAGQVVIITAETDDRVRALVRLDAYLDAYLYVGRFIDAKVQADLERTRLAAAQYTRLEQARSALEINFAVLFLLISLLLLLAAIWFGLLIANRLVTPIGEVVAAAEKIRGGDLTARVTERPDDDEIATLGRTFNRMTSQLAAQQAELITANRQLDERRRFTETVLSGVSAGVIGVDRDGLVTLPNPSALAMLEQSFDEVVGRPFAEVAPEMAELFNKLSDDTAEAVERGQVMMRRSSGTRTLLVRVAREVTGNELLGYVVTFDDVSELVAAQRNAAWADIARRIAHEIRNPLTPIQLSAERLKRKYLKEVKTDPEVFEQCTDTIIRQVGDIGRMVDEFSAFARMPRPVYREEDLGQLVRQAVFLQQVARQDIRFDSRLPNEPIRLSCDSRQIAQVLTNILQNAIDAIDGRERPEGEALPQGAVTVELRPVEGGAEIMVIDNGRGLPAENRDRLFEPYVTTRAKGTGLGLAIVKKIIEEHGGTISLSDAAMFDPTLKSGSLARIRLPLVQAAAHSGSETEPQQQSSSLMSHDTVRKLGSGSHGA